MSKKKNYSNRTDSKRGSNKSNSKQRKILNSYGYDISKFNVFDIPVRRESKTGRLISTRRDRQKDHLDES